MSSETPTVLRRMVRWLIPSPPESIRLETERRQLAQVQEQLPMLYMVAALNVLIIMAVCAHTGIQPRYYVWMAGLVLVALVRSVVWARRRQAQPSPAQVTSILKWSARLAFTMLMWTGVFSAYTFASGAFFQSTLIPISLAFGSMAIAHCFSTLRPAAVSALALGIVPSAATMVVVGAFDAQVLGVSMLTIALLSIRFVAGQYDQLVTEVHLQREVHDLANTDALTNLLNRRALLKLLEQELAAGSGNVFGVALLDLDGFKGVNDTLGHLAGDALLRVVAQRLAQSNRAGDSVGRLGGDEFLVVFRSMEDTADLKARVAHILSALCQPTDLAGETVMVQSSLGAALHPADGTTTAALFAAADDALYADKRARTGNVKLAEGAASQERRRHRAT